MDIFKGQNLLEFSDWFKTDLDCKEYLSIIKWKDSFKCLKCNHKGAQVRKDFSRTCNICGHNISRKALVTTDKWKGYRSIAKAYDITQIESNNGLNFKALHTMIHQIKSWIRTTYSWVSDFNINRYFNEFFFRINRSQNKATIFNILITRMVDKNKMYQKDLICN